MPALINLSGKPVVPKTAVPKSSGKKGGGKTATSTGGGTTAAATSSVFDPLTAWDTYNTTMAGINKMPTTLPDWLKPNLGAYADMIGLAKGNILTPTQVNAQANRTALTQEQA